MSARPQPLTNPSGELKEIVDRMAANMGFLPNSLLIMAKRPGFLKVVLPMISYMWGSENTIDRKLMAMVSYMCSYGSGCRYCQAHSIHVADQSDCDTEKLANLWQFDTSDLFDNRERAALSFALASGQVPNAVEDSHYEALTQYFSEEQILDMAIIVSVFGFLNRWNETLGVPLEEEPEKSARSILGDKAWQSAISG